MPRSTTYDYHQTLMDLEYIVHDDSGYRLGTKFLEIGARRRLVRIVQNRKPGAKQLADETGEYATLVIEEPGMGYLAQYSDGIKRCGSRRSRWDANVSPHYST
jgi:DNA-binding IclR family transcriptional regulator